MPRHAELATDEIHRIYDQTYADTTARDADTDWNADSGNVGKLVFVSGDSTLWLLLTTGPTWRELADGNSGETFYNADGSWSGNRTVTAQDGGALVFKATEDQGDEVGDDYTELRIQDGLSHFWRVEENGVGQQTYAGLVFAADASMTFIDSINSQGLAYQSDYSANFSSRSLVDQGYVLSGAAFAPRVGRGPVVPPGGVYS